jgi:LPPG:FO 2-phospho-L-lactate transferase
MREALRAANAPVVVVTPLPGGQAVKGPTAKIMGELGIALSAHSIEDHYRGLADAILLDTADPAIGTRHAFTDTWMHTLEDRVRVARAALDLAFA